MSTILLNSLKGLVLSGVFISSLIAATNIPEAKFLEKDTGKEALDWASKRTRRTQDYLKKNPRYLMTKKKVQEILYDQKKLISGVIRKGYVYNFWKDDKNPQGLWRRTPVGEYSKENPCWEVLIDFDGLSKTMKQKVVFRGATPLAPEDNRFLVQMSFGGNDETFFMEWDLTKKKFVKGFNSLKVHGKFTQGQWIDSDTILSNLVLNPKDLTASKYPDSLYIWKRGQDPSKAQRIFKVPSNYLGAFFNRLVHPSINPGLFLVFGWKDFFNSDLYLFDQSLALQKIALPSDVHYEGSFKEYVFFQLKSDWKIGKRFFPKGSLVSLHWKDLLKPDLDKKTLKVIYTPKPRESFNFISTDKNGVFLGITRNVNSVLYYFTKTDKGWTKAYPVKLPHSIGSVGVNSEENEDQALLTFENQIMAPSVYLWDETQELKQIRKPFYEYDHENYQVTQRYAVSQDGTKIPYYIAHKKGLVLDGKNPTLVTAYGGFGMINSPSFSRPIVDLWLKNGGVFVLGNIRGGGEFGPSWHEAAKQEKRQTGFNDFIAIAQDLIQNRITSPRYLAIKGGSNGGLLVATVMTQRPDLFGAVVCEVPIMDMLRYTEFGAGPSWVAEYGDPKDPKTRKILKSYAPCENISFKKTYPPLLITSSVNDQRVHPWHARILQYLMEKHPTAHSNTFFRESKDAGHGGGADLNDLIGYMTDYYAFLCETLGVQQPKG